jgi:hypothetical protein
VLRVPPEKTQMPEKSVRTETPPATRFSPVKRSVLASVFVVIGMAVSGCGYMIGPAHDAQLTTIAVPIFRNETFRRQIEFPLTEAVQKEIQKRTAMRIVHGSEAQTRLTGTIVDVGKTVLGENRFDDPRQLQLGITIRVKWEDLRNGRIISQQDVLLDANTVSLFTQSDFAPEVGHSLATATQDSIEQTARRIVDMLDAPW